jgi:hypothetical protein
MSLLRRYLPILTWGREYSSRKFIIDLIMAGIVTVGLAPRDLLGAAQSTETVAT